MIRGFKAPLLVLALMAVAVSGSSVASAAGPAHARPGSALFFPVFDAQENATTVITVSNTNSSTFSCGNGNRNGDVFIHYVYYDSADCNEFDTTEILTPGDTLTVLPGISPSHAPDESTGWLWVEAIDPETRAAIDFDFLIGSAIVVETGSVTNFLWAYTPFVFRAIPDYGTGPSEDSACGFDFTDVNRDGFADFDATEYEEFPAFAYIDNFFAEKEDEFSNRVYFMVPEGLLNSDLFELSFRIFDNEEGQTSHTDVISCWLGGFPLSDLTRQVQASRLGGDDTEGPDGVLTGWIEARVREFDTRDTLGVLGVYAHEFIAGTDEYFAGHEMQFDGVADVPVRLERIGINLPPGE